MVFAHIRRDSVFDTFDEDCLFQIKVPAANRTEPMVRPIRVKPESDSDGSTWKRVVFWLLSEEF